MRSDLILSIWVVQFPAGKTRELASRLGRLGGEAGTWWGSETNTAGETIQGRAAPQTNLAQSNTEALKFWSININAFGARWGDIHADVRWPRW